MAHLVVIAPPTAARSFETLNEFQPFQLYAVAADLGKVVLGLLQKPAFLVAAENLGQPHGHFGRYAALPVYKFRKRVARHPKAAASVMVKPTGSMHYCNTTRPG
jgi:hypothetical protein